MLVSKINKIQFCNAIHIVCLLLICAAGNRPHPASKDKPFKPNDPRLAFVAKEMDPRLHFALVCGAKVYIYIYI